MPYIVIDPTAAQVIPASALGNPKASIGETVTTLEAKLQTQLGGVRADITPAMQLGWINFAYRDLCSSIETDELKGSLTFDLVASQPLYLLPIQVRAIRALSVIDTVNYGDLGGRELEKIDLGIYRRRPDLTDEPRAYFRDNSVLVIWPTPIAVRTLSLDFWIRPNDLVGANDSPILNPEWHEAILLNARKKAFVDLEEFDKAAAAENDFVQAVRRRISSDEQEDENRIVGSSVPHRKRGLFRKSTFLRGFDGLR